MITSEWPTPSHPEQVPFLVDQVDALRQAGVEIELATFRGSMKPSNYLQAWHDLQRRFQTREWDLVHAQFGQAGLPALWPKPYPLVVTFHGSDLNGLFNHKGQLTFRGRVLRTMSQMVAKRADAVILVSQGLAASLPRIKYSVIPCGIDLEKFRPIPKAEARKRLGLDIDRRYVLFVGNASNPIKRYPLAYEATSRLPESIQAELLAVSNVPHSTMPLYLNAADVLLLTSIREGSPTVVKEALACNRAVVSTDVGDVRQRLDLVAGCVVCDDDDPATISRALHKVLARGGRIEGRHRVEALDNRYIARQIIDIYQQVVKAQAP